MTYLAREGVFTYYNPEDRALYYKDSSKLPVNTSAEQNGHHYSPEDVIPEPVVIATEMAIPEVTHDANHSHPVERNPLLAQTEEGKLHIDINNA